MLVKFWKSFKWFLFIPLIVFVFVFKISNVNALVYKNQVYTDTTIDGDNSRGIMETNTRKTINFHFTNFTQNDNYDLLVLKFGTFSFISTDNLTFTGLIGNNGGAYGNNCYLSGTTYYCSTNTVLNTQGSNLSTTNGITNGNIYITARLEYSGSNVPCTPNSELGDLWVCPILKNNSNKNPYLVLEINNYTENLSYNVSLNGVKYYYNYDSTEITIQQNTTNTNLQYIYTQQQQQGQYIQNDSTTGATTQMTGDFSDLASSFNSELQGVNDLSQLVLLPISLFMDLSTDNCQPLHLQIPYVNMSVDLPCMKVVFNQYFSGFYTIFTTIMSAVICYWVAIKSASLIKDIVDCDNDRIEVVDL